MATDFFADIPTIAYEGPDSDNELAYRFYDKNRVVLPANSKTLWSSGT